MNINQLRRSGFWRAIKKRKLFFTVAFFLLGCIFSSGLRFWVVSLIELPIHYNEYRKFGIRIPSGYSVHGIDVSRWQSKMDWERVQKMQVDDIRISFAFIKATEGGFRKDPQFDRNWAAAKQNGLIRGAYHFFRPSHSANMQSWNFKRAVSLRSGDLPPVLDVEEDGNLSKTELCRQVLACLKAFEINGRKPILYTNKDFYLQYFYKNPDFEPYKLWIAHYHVTDLELPKDAKWHFWQHSDRGNVNGTNEKVDFNVFNGELSDLKKLCLP